MAAMRAQMGPVSPTGSGGGGSPTSPLGTPAGTAGVATPRADKPGGGLGSPPSPVGAGAPPSPASAGGRTVRFSDDDKDNLHVGLAEDSRASSSVRPCGLAPGRRRPVCEW